MLQVLSDGEWHGIAELQRLTDLKENHIQKIAAFLNDFAITDTENKKVRLESYFQDFISRFF